MTPRARETPFSSSAPPNAPGPRRSRATAPAPRRQADATPHESPGGCGGRRSGADGGTDAAGREARDGGHAGPCVARPMTRVFERRGPGPRGAICPRGGGTREVWRASRNRGVSGVLPASPDPIRQELRREDAPRPQAPWAAGRCERRWPGLGRAPGRDVAGDGGQRFHCTGPGRGSSSRLSGSDVRWRMVEALAADPRATAPQAGDGRVRYRRRPAWLRRDRSNFRTARK